MLGLEWPWPAHARVQNDGYDVANSWVIPGQWHSRAQAARVVFWWSQMSIPGSPNSNLDPVLTFT